MPALPYSNGEVMIDLTATSPSAASTAAGSAAVPLGLSRFDAIAVEVTLTGATGGTLDVYLQVSHDYNPSAPTAATWWDYMHFTQLAAAAAAVSYRVDPALTNTVSTVGKGAVPALSAGTCAGGYWGDAVRVLFVAGAGTSAGASQTINFVGKYRMRP